jgi:hypothetical protein
LKAAASSLNESEQDKSGGKYELPNFEWVIVAVLAPTMIVGWYLRAIER